MIPLPFKLAKVDYPATNPRLFKDGSFTKTPARTCTVIKTPPKKAKTASQVFLFQHFTTLKKRKQISITDITLVEKSVKMGKTPQGLPKQKMLQKATKSTSVLTFLKEF